MDRQPGQNVGYSYQAPKKDEGYTTHKEQNVRQVSYSSTDRPTITDKTFESQRFTTERDGFMPQSQGTQYSNNLNIEIKSQEPSLQAGSQKLTSHVESPIS